MLDQRTARGVKIARQPASMRFDKQREVERDESRHIALLCGRRAGKTEELAYEAVEVLADNQRSHVVFVGLTARSAREIFFAKICSLNTLHQWGLQINQQRMSVTDTVTDSTLLVMGSDTREDLDRIRGIERLALLVCDECGQWRPSLLHYVAEESAGPALMDLGGKTILSGTPGRVLAGYWYDVTTGKLPGWSLRRWTSLDNPHVPAREWLAELLKNKGWDENNPIYRREYLAEWCTDTKSLVMSSFSDDNIKPCGCDSSYVTSLILDFGVVHNTAFLVLGHKPSERAVKVFHSEQHTGLAPTQVADIGKALKQQYQCSRVIGDVGGMGKAHAQEFQLRHGIYVEAADKRDKLAGIELTNDRFRTHSLEIDPINADLIKQCRSVQWDEYHADIADGQEDDLLDTLIYGNKAVLHRYIEPAPKTDTPPELYIKRPKPYWQIGLDA
jgi:hypothetical protein